MNGWLLVRIAGIVVGIATLLRVATNEGIVTYDPLFLAWMDRLRDWLELGLLMDILQPILERGIDLVRSFGINVPDLQGQWRAAFVLNTLMLGRVAQHSGIRELLVAAPVGALIVAVLSGFYGTIAPVMIVSIFTTGGGLFIAMFFRSTLHAVLLLASFAGALVIVTATDLAPIKAAFLVALVAAGSVLDRTVTNFRGGWRAVFADASFNIGVDILGVMLGALFIASLFANPPIW